MISQFFSELVKVPHKLTDVKLTTYTRQIRGCINTRFGRIFDFRNA